MLYNINEITLIPVVKTSILHRGDCECVYKNDKKLPLYIAPMSSLINEKNIRIFEKSNFNTILPRNIDFNIRFEYLEKGYTVAFGLDETEYLYDIYKDILERKTGSLGYTPKICIDQANGHMEATLDVVDKLKKLLGINGIYVIAGNIANPETYWEYAKVGIDAVRIGIGAGSVCTTSLQTGIHYPMASLIMACKAIKDDIHIDKIVYKSAPAIIADGGFERIDQVIKALALGADYVMLGRMISSLQEAAGDIVYIDNESFRKYYGMSTRIAQEEILSAKKDDCEVIYKNEEGTSNFIKVNSNIDIFIKNFCAAIKSTMSYTDHRFLEDFIGNVEFEIMSPTTLNKPQSHV